MFKPLKAFTKYTFVLIIAVNCWLSNAQEGFFLKDDVGEKINFQLISNLIIIPIEINNVTLSFILDTGVSNPILFNLTERDSLDLKNTKSFYLHGLGGDGKIEALKSSHNKFRIGDAVSINQDLFVVFDETINFTPRLGISVNGIIGYDVFKNYVVEINYNSKYIRLYNPNRYKPKTSKKWKAIPITIHSKKPYLDAKVIISENEKLVKLLIDTGSSDALWLFEDKKTGLAPYKDLFFTDYLGKGLSGSVYGKRSKVKNFEISDFNLKNVNVAFPDSTSINVAKVYKERKGSLGGSILKRFNLFFDYTNEKLYLKKNSFFRESFTYNNSGIVIEHNGVRFVKEQIRVPNKGNYNRNNNNSQAVQIDFSINYIMSLQPAYKIVEIRPSSNAYAVGLKKGDVLININGKPVHDYELAGINKILHGKTGKSIRLKIERKGVELFFKFKLDDAFKINEPSN
ncbi:aspartyl protease family protein [Winogradskyella sp.]|uniref:pepsin/retropepsin-like aspartic protease family protein n=1 Tax=Winogradskyella sp. TaxID=1883156 RepID=UPI0025D87FD0|nr:aspartyl protease family protein [Winogradskyella sp.]